MTQSHATGHRGIMLMAASSQANRRLCRSGAEMFTNPVEARKPGETRAFRGGSSPAPRQGFSPQRAVRSASIP